MATRTAATPAHSAPLRLGSPGAGLPQASMPALVALATLGAAGIFGLLAASRLELALLALGAALVLPLALWSVPALVAVWVGVVYVGAFPGLEGLPNRLLLVGVGAGLIAAGARGLRRRTLLPTGRRILPLFALFVFWQLLSLTWADDVAFAEEIAKEYVYVTLGVVLVFATIRTRRHVRWVALAFVVGAVVSVTVGIAQGGLTAAGSGAGVDPELSRFAAGSGDPNYLAAMLVPAMMLAGGLALGGSQRLRVGLLASVIIMALGLAATQSRGGLIALAVSLAAAYFVLRDQRRLVLRTAGTTLAALAAFFVVYPGAWERIVSVKDGGGGSGRTDIWSVAWTIISDHPFVGVGLNQFSVVSPTYVRQPGSLSGATALIVDQAIVVHNVLLQLWAETGVVGLALYLAVVAASFTAAARAARDFDAVGDAEMAGVARAVILALVGVLTASLFLSNVLARQVWVLLALGPVLAMVARRQAQGLLSAVPARR